MQTQFKERINRIKQTHRIEDVVSRYLEIKKNGSGYKTLCPVHDDTDPSFHIDPERQRYKCFGCGISGDVIDFVSLIEHCSKKQATELLEKNIHHRGTEGTEERIEGIKIETTKHTKETKGKDKSSVVQVFKQLITFYQGNLSKSSEAQEYLKKRGLFDPEMVQHFQIGFCSGGARKLLPDDPDLLQGLKEMGLLNDRGNETFYTCITFPVFDAQGVPVGLYGRSIHRKQHLYLKGAHKGLFNFQALKVYKEIILTESIIDALSAWKLGARNVIPLYGTQGLTPVHLEMLREHCPEEIILFLDSDDAGRKATEEISGRLKELNVRISAATLPEGNKDINEFLTNGETPETFQQCLEERRQLSAASEQKGTGLRPEDSGPDEMRFDAGEFVFTVKGLKTISDSAMRVIMTVTRAEQFHTDKVDLYSHRSRKSFARTLESELSIPAPGTERRLLEILRHLQKHLKNKSADKDEEKTVIITAEQRAEAIEFLKSPDLLSQISSDLETLGYTGEDKNKKLCYLVATSRKLPTPLSCMIRSQSGAGKSLLMERVAALMPEEDIFLLSRLSTQGLYYMPRDALSHKLLIIDERRGSEEADYSIRSLQSRKKLSLAVVMKDPNSGKQRTQFFEIFGPVAYMDSSTEMEANPENENRCFVVYLDETREQTLKVLRAQQKSRMAEGIASAARKEALTRLHKNAQRVLRPLRVVIPFADKIQFPLSWLRVRRDHERFLSLIEASAFLHQYQRPVRAVKSDLGAVKSDVKAVKSEELREKSNDQYFIEATIDDYRVAYDLSKDILSSTFSDMNKLTSDILKTIRDQAAKKAEADQIHAEKVVFTQRDVRAWTRLAPHIVKRSMRDLLSLEYISASFGASGSRYKYTLNGAISEDTDLLGLTTPDELLKAGQSGTDRDKPFVPVNSPALSSLK